MEEQLTLKGINADMFFEQRAVPAAGRAIGTGEREKLKTN
jgi:hypothetical protein